MVDQAAIDELRAQPVAPQQLLVGSAWVDAAAGTTRDVVSPVDGRSFASIAEASKADVDRAVAAARAAFADGRWADMAPSQRKQVMHRWADLIEANAVELAVLGVRDNGTEIAMAIAAEPGSAAATIRYYAEAVDKVYGEVAPTPADTVGLVQREPVGVVAAIIPWNFPLMIGAWKYGAALAVGNSVVVKPSETASLSTLAVARLGLEAGIPEGVLNVVTGEGGVVGEALALHMDVDVLAFTGSGATGRKLLEYAARSNLKATYLELGGKSPNIVFADCPDLDVAARRSAAGIFRNAGQVCVAGSRLLVEASIRDEFVAKLAAEAGALEVGDPLSLESDVGAVHSETQLARIVDHVAAAEAAGARRVTGGDRVLRETGGYYMAPTVMDQVDPQSSLAQDEVFGPVVAVLSFSDEGEAIRLANGTSYGLAAGVWTSDLSRAHRVSRALDAGVVMVNTYGGADITVPLGGVKESGNGVDKSLHALDKYTNLKSVWMQLS